MKKTQTTSTILLKHHLKALRLPTVLSECEKVAHQCATDNVDHLGYLLQLTELELVDRERRASQRRLKAARFPSLKTLEDFDCYACSGQNHSARATAMIPPEQASQITFKRVMFNSKIVIATLMIGLAVVTAVFAVVQIKVFGQGVFKNEPEMSTILIIVAAVFWVVLIPVGYFAPKVIFDAKDRRVFSASQQSISLQAGSDAEALEQTINALDVDIRAELLSNYLARVVISYALFEGAGMTNAIFFLLTGSMANLLLVLATLVVMAVLFPTLAQFRQLECLSAV